MQRYFINSTQVHNNIITIINSDVHHIKNVMRMKIDDEIIVCDELENVYLGKIITISNEEVKVEIVKNIDAKSELPINVTIAHGLVRREKTEEVIRRLAELGCYEYQPIIMNRSIVKVVNDKSERQNKIIKEACEQSQRNRLMILSPVIDLKKLIARKDEFSLCLYADFNPNVAHLKPLLQKFTGKNILVVIGPEGGFSIEEVTTLDKAGFIPITLGKRVLRTETAPLYVMSVIGYEFEKFSL